MSQLGFIYADNILGEPDGRMAQRQAQEEDDQSTKQESDEEEEDDE